MRSAISFLLIIVMTDSSYLTEKCGNLQNSTIIIALSVKLAFILNEDKCGIPYFSEINKINGYLKKLNALGWELQRLATTPATA